MSIVTTEKQVKMVDKKNTIYMEYSKKRGGESFSTRDYIDWLELQILKYRAAETSKTLAVERSLK